MLPVHTGMRQGEVLGLKWKDVNLEAGKLQVRRTLSFTKDGPTFTAPKTVKSRRSVKLTAGAVKALRSHLQRQLKKIEKAGSLYQDTGLVFAKEDGTPVRGNRLSDYSFKRLLWRAGLPHAVRFHNLRHTCATLLLSRGVPPKLVQELLGHAKIAITLDTYSHVLPGMGDQTATAMESALS